MIERETEREREREREMQGKRERGKAKKGLQSLFDEVISQPFNHHIALSRSQRFIINPNYDSLLSFLHSDSPSTLIIIIISMEACWFGINLRDNTRTNKAKKQRINQDLGTTFLPRTTDPGSPWMTMYLVPPRCNPVGAREPGSSKSFIIADISSALNCIHSFIHSSIHPFIHSLLITTFQSFFLNL